MRFHILVLSLTILASACIGIQTDQNQPSDSDPGQILAGNSSAIYDFDKSKYEEALKSDKLIVLYFYANWCPICRAEVPKMYFAFGELNHTDVIGFRVNYNDGDTDDFEKALAKQYGITYQHTKVFLKDGKVALKSLEEWDKDRYLAEINKALGN